jgi:phosphatidylserine decarboxylase
VTDPLRRAASRAMGLLADLPVPRPLRGPVYRGYARITGANLEEAGLPLEAHPSLGDFFTRPLREGLRPVDPDPLAVVSPVDGRVQRVGPIVEGQTLQAKGRPYAVRQLLAGVGEDIDLEGGCAMTLYLSPSDYHRIHSPCAASISEARWVRGHCLSVAPKVLDRRLVLPINERCVLRLETAHGPLLFVLVAALNVARLIVRDLRPDEAGTLAPPLERAAGEELGRFELGSTVILVAPPGVLDPDPSLAPGSVVRLGRRIGSFLRA